MGLANLANNRKGPIMQITIHAAKTNLSKLIDAALKGEEVIIARGDTPVVRLVPVEAKKAFKFGVIPELVGTQAPDFLEPMTEEELREWE
jgi:prevent-host-death family protein